VTNLEVSTVSEWPLQPRGHFFWRISQLGFESIISKREDSPYRSGRSPDWIKLKNPKSPAVKREAEEDWGK
jgi:ATP-dependent DNA ligase